MKTAIYIEDGDVQLVLTPQNEWERNALKSFGPSLNAKIMEGEFYTCEGGWHRHSYYGDTSGRSLIIRVQPEVKAV